MTDPRLKTMREAYGIPGGPGQKELDGIRPGGFCQIGLKTGPGIDTAWVEIRGMNRNVLDGFISDPPDLRGPIRFQRRHVWQVI